MLDTPTYLPKLKEFEGNYSYMYLDTTGNVTVGVGEMLPNAAAAQKFAFVRRADATAKPPVLPGPATADEIKADFDNVKKPNFGEARHLLPAVYQARSSTKRHRCDSNR